MEPPVRLLAVLGYSEPTHHGLHPICADRLATAERAAVSADVVLLSGSTRDPRSRPEAELMREAWRGPARPLVCDPSARTTVENALGVAARARALDATEVVVVTSRWHAPRARVLVRAAVAGTAVRVRTDAAPGRPAARKLAREAACMLALPYQLMLIRRSRPASDG